MVTSQDLTRPKTRQTHHILIIDDSARLRQTLADLIVANCLATGKIFKVFHSDKDGRYTQSNEVPSPGMLLLDGINRMDSAVIDEFTVYTAPSPKQALFVINSPVFSRLTIISDVMMPADTEVGLVGMLDAIAKRNLLVNLVFASSDSQNSFVVAKLVEIGKAYFIVKQGSVWEDLSKSLVQRAEAFSFKTITPLDFQGMQKIAGIAMRTGHSTALPEKPKASTTAPVPVQEEATLGVFSANPPASPAPRPKIKPLPTLNHLPRVEGVPTPNKPFNPEATRPPVQPLPSQVAKTQQVPVNPGLPPLPVKPAIKMPQPQVSPDYRMPQPPVQVNPGPKMPHLSAQNAPVISNPQTEAPRIAGIEGFMPVTPTTPPMRNTAPPMPVWEDLVAPQKPEPAEKDEMVYELEGRAIKNLANTGFSNLGESTLNSPDLTAVNTLPTQTQTRLSQFAESEEKKKQGFFLFRPFKALAKRFRKKSMFERY